MASTFQNGNWLFNLWSPPINFHSAPRACLAVWWILGNAYRMLSPGKDAKETTSLRKVSESTKGSDSHASTSLAVPAASPQLLSSTCLAGELTLASERKKMFV